MESENLNQKEQSISAGNIPPKTPFDQSEYQTNTTLQKTPSQTEPNTGMSFPDEEISPAHIPPVATKNQYVGPNDANNAAGLDNTSSKTVQKVIDPDLKNLRTYEDDIKNAVQNNDVSSTKIFMAEQVKKERAKQQIPGNEVSVNKRPQKPLSKKALLTFVSLILFAIGGVAIYYNLEYLKPYFENINQPRISNMTKIIDVNREILINSQGKTKSEIIRNIQKIVNDSNNDSVNEIIEIIITKEVAGGAEVGKQQIIEKISRSDFFNLIDANAPDLLLRSFTDEVVIGVHKKGVATPFIILQSENLNQTYAGMLNWERSLGNDMKDIFSNTLIPTKVEAVRSEARIEIEDEDEIQEEAESLANENNQLQLPTFDIRIFVDRIVANKDTRAIVDSENNILFFYSIVDNKNIVITTNRETLVLVLDRINRARLIR